MDYNSGLVYQEERRKNLEVYGALSPQTEWAAQVVIEVLVKRVSDKHSACSLQSMRFKLEVQEWIVRNRE